MSEKHDIRRLMGLDTTRPTLAEARLDDRAIDETEQLFAAIRDAMDEAQMGEMKLGIAGRMGGAVEPDYVPPQPKRKKAPDEVKADVAAWSLKNKRAKTLPIKTEAEHDHTMSPEEMHGAHGSTMPDSPKTRHSAKADAHRDEYWKMSGKAHHQSHMAHTLTAMIKSGEMHGDDAHKVAHDAHRTAMSTHADAQKHGQEAGVAHATHLHGPAISGHEKGMGRHGKKLGIY